MSEKWTPTEAQVKVMEREAREKEELRLRDEKMRKNSGTPAVTHVLPKTEAKALPLEQRVKAAEPIPSK